MQRVLSDHSMSALCDSVSAHSADTGLQFGDAAAVFEVIVRQNEDVL